ncbi:MAG TPA: lytic transglycosylase domain-containing protein [Streptosporangiaceae bacterium]
MAAAAASVVMLWPAHAADAGSSLTSAQAHTSSASQARYPIDTAARLRLQGAVRTAQFKAVQLKAARQAAARRAAARKAAAAAAARRAAEQQQAQTPAPAPSSPAPVAPAGTAQQIAAGMLGSYGWSSSQFSCLVSLWNVESGWNVTASNPSSGAYGIPQALPGSKMASAGADWQTNAATQIRWGLGYIKSVYGSPCGAWSHEQADGWY